MLPVFTKFTKDENGAVTVDWVVLTAAIVGLSIAVIATISGGALNEADGLGAHLSSQAILTY